MTSSDPSALSRRLGLRDAVVVGRPALIGGGAGVSRGAPPDLAGGRAPPGRVQTRFP